MRLVGECVEGRRDAFGVRGKGQNGRLGCGGSGGIRRRHGSARMGPKIELPTGHCGSVHDAVCDERIHEQRIEGGVPAGIYEVGGRSGTAQRTRGMGLHASTRGHRHKGHSSNEAVQGVVDRIVNVPEGGVKRT